MAKHDFRARGGRRWLGWVVLAWLSTCGGLVRGAPSIEFELATEPGFPLTGAQTWLELFARLGESSLRIRQAGSQDRPAIEQTGTASQPRYRVTGLLTARNRLVVPGGEFGISDRSRLAAWIQKLRDEGAEAPGAKVGAYALTDEQLVAFHDQLARRVECASRDRRAGDVARDIVQSLGIPFAVTEPGKAAFRAGGICQDDVQSMASGTALAAVLRPLGLVFRPEKASGGQVRLLICGVDEAQESWPVGWPPQEIPAKAAPALFESLKVTITNQKLPDVLAAIQPRIKMPILFDRESLARKRIDLPSAVVSHTKNVDTYQQVLSRVFYQAKLTSELRIDEAGQPFLWVRAR